MIRNRNTNDRTLAGPAFPFRFESGGLRMARGLDKIEQDVHHLLSTRLGERFLLRGYGGGVHHRLQAPNNSTLRALIKHEIEAALLAYMPAVRLTAPVSLTAIEDELLIVVAYTAEPLDVARRLELRIP